MTPDKHPSVYAAAREKGRTTLHALLGEHVAPVVADAITDAALEAGLEMAAANRLVEPGADGYGHPVEWLVYNAMHQRALRAEYALERAGLPVPEPVAAQDGGCR